MGINIKYPKKYTQMKHLLLITMSTFFLFFKNIAQTKITINYACSYYGEKNPTSVYTFSSDSEAISALEKITNASGLATNFKIMAANVPNAAAIVFNNQRYILYNQSFMYNLDKRTNYWASLSILAHEVGHHLNGHSLVPGGSRPEIELEADKFSGFILAKLGATLEESQSAINSIVTETGSLTHPGRSARLAAIANGWYQNSSQVKIESSSKFISKPSKLFGGTMYDKDIQQVYLTKLSNVEIKFSAEKGYVFRESEYRKIRITEDIMLFWFPDYYCYGYLTDYSKINLNTPVELKMGTIPIYLNGIHLESEYMIIYFPNRSFHIISHGEIVTNKARYISSRKHFFHPGHTQQTGEYEDTYDLYEIPADGKLQLIQVSKNEFEKTIFSNKITLKRGKLEK